MSLTQHPANQPIVIQKIMTDGLLINETLYENSLILTADFQILTWEAKSVSELTLPLLRLLLQGEPELVIIGTGQETAFLSPALSTVFYERGIGVEVMTTNAAVRTYTILTSEDRKVTAGLII